MTKFIIYFIPLLNLYNCQKEERPMLFEVNPNIGNEKEFTVQVGQDFIIKLYTSITSYVLLNKNDKDSISYTKSEYQGIHDEDEKLGFGRRGYILYFFKANAVTDSPKLLKFSDTYSYLRERDPSPKFIVKINVN